PNNSKVAHQSLQDMNMKDNMLIAYIVRGNKLIFPSGKDTLEPGDQVIITTTIKSLENIEDILA
ncbi:MAG: TrkA C-terminal domain-containing protein, partial [Alkalibacterium sp.]